MRVQCTQDNRMSLLILLGLCWVSQLCCNTTVMERRFWIWWRDRLMCVVVVVVFVFLHGEWNMQQITSYDLLHKRMWLSTHHHLYTHCHHFIINTVIYQCSELSPKHKYVASEILPYSTTVICTLSVTGLNMNFQISRRKMTFSDYLIQHVSKHAFRWHYNSMISFQICSLGCLVVVGQDDSLPMVAVKV